LGTGQRQYRKYPGFFTAVGLVLVILLLGYYFWLEADWKRERILLTSAILLIPFILFVIEFFRPHVVIDPQGISVTYGSFGRRRTYSWQEIKKVQGSWETELEVVPNSGSSVQILFYQLPKKHRKSLRQDLHQYLVDRVRVAGNGSKSQA
jgi:hypothetical protein